jgi:hypothetical protein
MQDNCVTCQLGGQLWSDRQTDESLSGITVTKIVLTTQVKNLDTESKTGPATCEIETTLDQKCPDRLHFECAVQACQQILDIYSDWVSWYDIFVNCNCVATRWAIVQYTYTQNIWNNTKQTIHRTTQNKQYTEQHKTNNTQNNTRSLEVCGPCPVFMGFTLAFVL